MWFRKWIEYVLMSLCSLAVLQAVTVQVFGKVPFSITCCYIPVALIIGRYLQFELKEALTGWDRRGTNLIEKLQDEFITIIGVCTLYYFSMMAAMVLIFPEYESDNYRAVFAVITLGIYSCYRLTMYLNELDKQTVTKKG